DRRGRRARRARRCPRAPAARGPRPGSPRREPGWTPATVDDAWANRCHTSPADASRAAAYRGGVPSLVVDPSPPAAAPAAPPVGPASAPRAALLPAAASTLAPA